jgi:hypothetical protein
VSELERKLKDFRNFVFLSWDHLGLPEPTPIQLDISQYLQKGPRRRVVQAFRGVGKSWLTSAYVVFRLLHDPRLNVLVVSASKQRADDFSTFTLRLINEIPICQHLKPREDQRNSKIAFDVGPASASQAPSVVSKGITSQITGSRADLIIADDVESLNNSATFLMREKLLSSIAEFEAVLKPGGEVIYLGTPQTEQSIYHGLHEKGYDTRIWPARYPDNRLKTAFGTKLAPTLAEGKEGDPTDPRRFNALDLMEREASYGRTGFALQFMLDSTLSDADRYPLKLADLIVLGLNPESAPEKPIWAANISNIVKDIPCVGFNGDRYYGPMDIQGKWIPYEGGVMAIDPSGRGDNETAYAVVKMLNGYLYVTAAGGVKGGYSEETLRKLVKVAKNNAVNRIICESNFGDGMFTELLKPYLVRDYPCTVEEVRHNIQKERRIVDTLEPVMNQHRLVIDSGVIREDYESTKQYASEKALHYSLMWQMSRMTRNKGALAYDDRIDVLSMAVSFWVEQMGQDAARKMAIRKDDVLQAELDRFMEHSVGRRSQGGSSWISI